MVQKHYVLQLCPTLQFCLFADLVEVKRIYIDLCGLNRSQHALD